MSTQVREKIFQCTFSKQLKCTIIVKFFQGVFMGRTYIDGITDYTEPFWDNLCPKCKKRFWSVTLECVCPECGNKELYILNESKHLKHDAEELKEFNRKIMEEKDYESCNSYEL